MRQGKNLELLLEKISDLIIPGATIKSPEYVNDIDTGTLREVDVGIRLNTEKGSVFIAIECRDRGGVQDIQWIEQLISKKQSIQADILIAVVTSDFTRPAKVKAFKKGIYIRTIEQFSRDDILLWLDETYAEVHNFIVEVKALALQLDSDVKTLPLNLEKSNYYDGKTQKEISFEKLLAIINQQLIDEVALKPVNGKNLIDIIPNHGNKIHGSVTFYVNHIYLIMPSSIHLVSSSKRERIAKVKLEFILEKNIEHYPIASICEYKDYQPNSYNLLAEYFEYKSDKGKFSELVVDAKNDNAVWYLDLSQIDSPAKIFAGVTLKCKKPVFLSKYALKFK